MSEVMALAVGLLLSMSPWNEPTATDSVTGTLKSHNLMAQVAANRGYISDPTEYSAWLSWRELDGGFAAISCGDLGRHVWVVWGDGTVDRCIVLDCAHPHHYPHRMAQGDIGEVGARLWAQRAGGMPVQAVVIYGLGEPAVR